MYTERRQLTWPQGADLWWPSCVAGQKTSTGRLDLWHQPDWRSDLHDCRSPKKKKLHWDIDMQIKLAISPRKTRPIDWSGVTGWDSRYHGGRRPSSDDSYIGTRQTEYHEALPSSANVQPHLTSSFADDGNPSWYLVCRVPMVEMTVGLWKLSSLMSSLDGRWPPWYRPQASRFAMQLWSSLVAGVVTTCPEA